MTIRAWKFLCTRCLRAEENTIEIIHAEKNMIVSDQNIVRVSTML